MSPKAASRVPAFPARAVTTDWAEGISPDVHAAAPGNENISLPFFVARSFNAWSSVRRAPCATCPAGNTGRQQTNAPTGGRAGILGLNRLDPPTAGENYLWERSRGLFKPGEAVPPIVGIGARRIGLLTAGSGSAKVPAVQQFDSWQTDGLTEKQNLMSASVRWVCRQPLHLVRTSA
jgi:hypothetical protein